MRAPLRPVMSAALITLVLLADPSAAAADPRSGRSPLAEAVADAARLVGEAAAVRAETPTPPASTKAKRRDGKSDQRLAWPVEGIVTSEFGMRWGRPHRGIDVGLPTGSAVLAPADGVYIGSAWMTGYGLVLHLDHGGGVNTFYAHLSAVAKLEPGQRVRRGDLVAKTGSTGLSTAPHLHFEVRVGPDAHDPRRFLKGEARPRA